MRRAILVLAAVVTCCLARSSQCDAAAYAYVANRGNNTVSAIRISDKKITEIRVDDRLLGSAFIGVSIAREGDYVYVANPKKNVVYVIDTSRVTETPDDAVVARVDNAVVARVAVGSKPIGVAVSPDGHYVYIVNHGDGTTEGTVSVIEKISDPTSDPPSDFWKEDPVDPITVGIDPIGVAVSPDGDRIYVTNRGNNTLSVIEKTSDPNSDSWELLGDPITVGTEPIGVAVSGDCIYVVNHGGDPDVDTRDGTLSVIKRVDDGASSTDDKKYEIKSTVTLGRRPIGVAVSPDGAEVYVTNKNSDTLYVIDPNYAVENPDDADEAVKRTISVEPRPVGVAVTPDGEYVCVTSLGEGTEDDTEEETEDDTGHGTVSFIDTSDYSVMSTKENKSASFGQFVGSISAPEAPKDLTATTESESRIDLSWTHDCFDESGFEIERKAESETLYIEINDPNVTSYSDTEVEPDTTYTYRVRAYKEDGGNSDYSAYSNEAEATTPIILEAPSNLTATEESDSRIRLSWTNNSYGALGVEIQRKEVSEETDSETDAEDSDETGGETDTSGTFTRIAEVGADVTKYSDGGLEPYTTYQYRVRAYGNADAVSGWSNQAKARTDDECFIATAAYGSLIDPHVVTLRHFRDAYLIPHTLGRVFVRTYYQYSPPIAHFISKHDTLRAAVRVGLLPLVAISYCTLHFGPAITVTMLMVLLAIPIVLVSSYRRKVRVYRANC